eukprot:5390706-Alexandrium_andersonii.AAC.1
MQGPVSVLARGGPFTSSRAALIPSPLALSASRDLGTLVHEMGKHVVNSLTAVGSERGPVHSASTHRTCAVHARSLVL